MRIIQANFLLSVTLLQRLAKVFNTNLHWCQALFRGSIAIRGFIFRREEPGLEH